jgi:hypothetical protein
MPNWQYRLPRSDFKDKGLIMAMLDSLDKKAKPAIAAALEPGEEVTLAIPGESGSALVATNRRVLLYKRGITAGSAFGKQLNSWDYSMISGVEAKQAMTTKTIILQIPGALPVTKIGRFDKGPQSVWEAPNALMVNISNFDRAIATLRRLIEEHRHAANPSQVASDPVEQLKQWAALRDQGVLTDEEFQHQKRKLLGM